MNSLKSRSHGHKYFEYEFCTHTRKPSNQNVTPHKYSKQVDDFGVWKWNTYSKVLWTVWDMMEYSKSLFLHVNNVRLYLLCLRYLCLIAKWCSTHIVLCCLLCLASSCVPQCCQFLRIVNYWLLLRFSLTFI